MEIGKSFTFFTEDARWPEKLGLSVLISATPVLNFAFTGFMVDLMRNVAAGQEKPLPDWSDIGDKLVRGLLLLIAYVIYMLPVFVIGCLLFAAALMPAFAVSGQGDQGLSQGLALGVTALLIALLCVIGVYFLLFILVSPAIMIHYSRQGSFGACFQLQPILKIITGNLSEYLTAFVIYLALTAAMSVVVFIVSLILGFIPCIGMFLAWAPSLAALVYVSVVYSHLFGQVGAKAALEGGAA